MSRNTTTDDDVLADLPIVPEPATNHLNEKQEAVYRDHRKKLARWAVTIGNDTDEADGCAHETVKCRLYRLDKFYRYVWDAFDGFTVDIRPDHTDAWMREISVNMVRLKKGIFYGCRKGTQQSWRN